MTQSADKQHQRFFCTAHSYDPVIFVRLPILDDLISFDRQARLESVDFGPVTAAWLAHCSQAKLAGKSPETTTEMLGSADITKRVK